jgi:hypothetical protein
VAIIFKVHLIPAKNEKSFPVMKPKILFLLGFFLLIMSPQMVQAQQHPDSLIYRIELRNGNTFMGSIMTQDSSQLVLQTVDYGRISIPKRDIARMTQVRPGRAPRPGEGTGMFENPQATRYFWTPNGYGLHRGEAYYQNVWVLFNQAAVGITENISIGAGMVPLFLFGGAATPAWFTAKASFPVVPDRINLGAGALVGTMIGGGEDSKGSAGLLFGLSTFGSRDKNVSLGLGYGFAGGEMASTPVINIGGMLRTCARGYLLTENYLIRTGGETYALSMVGGRRIIDKAGLDYGLLIPIGIFEKFIALPWLGITVPFGNIR